MNGRRRYIRRVTAVAKDGLAKKVRDRREGVEIERILAAQKSHHCDYRHCPETNKHIIAGEPYLRVTWLGTNLPGRRPPTQKAFHLECLPEEFHPCLRFFQKAGA